MMRSSARLLTRSAGLAVMALGACASPKPGTDTTDATGLDTLKPAMASMQAPDTVKPAPAVTKTTTKRTSTTTTSTKTTSTKSVKDTAHLGRDSAIKIDTRDPRRQLPTIPPQKPPQ